MHIGTRRSLASGRMLRAMLLGLGTISMVIPGNAVDWSQSVLEAAPPLFSAIDLHPRGREIDESWVEGISEGQQVGESNHTGRSTPHHALLWRGSADSVVDLNPSGFVESEAHAVCGGQQVGWVIPAQIPHAFLWRGSAASTVDLHPRGFDDSEAFGTSGFEQVGYGGVSIGIVHALLWRGSAASVVDLHPRGFTSTEALSTSAGLQVGYGSGPATGGNNHALLWRGSAGSVVDLHPLGFDDSEAWGTSGGLEVGYGSGPFTGGHDHALLWRGTGGSVVDLNPRGFTESQAYGTSGEEQVGEGYRPPAPGGHALLWHGSAASVVDLHVFLPPWFSQSSASGIDEAGNVIGTASGSSSGTTHAILWKRNVSEPDASRGRNANRC